MSFDADYKPKEWSKLVSNKKGYGVLTILNDTNLQYVRKASSDGEIVDHFMIQKQDLRTFGWPEKNDNENDWIYIIGISGLIVIFIVLVITAYKCRNPGTPEELQDDEVQFHSIE